MNNSADNQSLFSNWKGRLFWQLPLLAIVLFAASSVQEKMDAQIDKMIPETVSFTSTNNKKASGYSALYELSERIGLKSKRWDAPYRDLEKENGVLFIVSPSQPLKDVEIDQILSWVQSGNTLIYMDYCMYGSGEHLLSKLGLRIKLAKATDDLVLTDLPAAAESAHVKRLVLASETRIYGGDALLKDKQGAFMSQVGIGKGRCFIATLPNFCANRRISNTADWGNFQFILNLLKSSNGVVLFDERVHGFSSSQNVFVRLAHTPIGLAVLQLSLIFLVAFMSLNQRFGRIQLIHERRKIASSEFIDGMALTYAKARAFEAALHILYGSFRQRLCKALSLDSDEKSEALSAAWSQTGTVKSEDAANFVRSADRLLAQEKITEEDLISTMVECDRLHESSKSTLALQTRRRGG